MADRNSAVSLTINADDDKNHSPDWGSAPNSPSQSTTHEPSDMVFADVISTVSFLKPQSDDDFTDRMHYYYTSTFLLLTAMLISVKMFGGRPLECFMPAEFRPSWEDYTEMYCWASNTYWVESTSRFPEDEEQRQEKMISYYQWSPFFLVSCALLFYSPCLIWRIMYEKSGIRLKDLMSFANDKSNIQPQSREANVRGMSAHLGSVFRHRYRFGSAHPYHHRYLRLLNLRFYEAYLTLLYLGIKCLYLLNVLSQMWLMNWFLQTDNYTFYGWGVLNDLPGVNPVIFPGYPFAIWRFGIWVMYNVIQFNVLFVARRLELADVGFKRKHVDDTLNRFVQDYIKMDGIFVLKMLTIHSGILMCTELVDSMWDDFIALEEKATPECGVLMPRRKTSVLVPLMTKPDQSGIPTSPHPPGTPHYESNARFGSIGSAAGFSSK